MRAIDTNVLVRALVQDDPAQSARAMAMLSAHQVFIPITVILELEWVLRSHYGFTQPMIALALGKVASLENAVIGDHMAVVAATENLARGWDLSQGIHWPDTDEDISVTGLFAGQPSVEYREAYA